MAGDTTKVVVPDCVQIHDQANIDAHVVFVDGPLTTAVASHASIEPAAVIFNGVTIGQGALVQAGSVVTRSVPPNAIVQGNPAIVTGYTNDDLAMQTDVRTLGASVFGKLEAPSKFKLNLGNSAIYLMRRVVDARGGLSVGEVDRELPFIPQRYFLVFDVPSSELRGEHAHKTCHQFLICVHGSVQVLLDDGNQRTEVTLDRPELGVFMPAGIWGTQYQYTQDAVLLVFASLPYDADDYLRTYDEFLNYKRETAN